MEIMYNRLLKKGTSSWKNVRYGKMFGIGLFTYGILKIPISLLSFFS